MEDTLYKEESLIRYLLGQLSEEEQARLEEKFFEEKDCFEQLQIVESELIDSYVHGRLSVTNRVAFESGFLHLTERREKVEFAQAWKVFIEGRQASHAKVETDSFFQSFLYFIRSKPLRLIPVGVALLFLLGSAWLVFENVRLRDRLEKAQNSASEIAGREQELIEKLSQERQHAEQLAVDLETERLNRASPDPANIEPTNLLAQIVPFTLYSESVRSTGGIQRLELSANAKTIRLTMVFAREDQKKVVAAIQKVGGTITLQQAELKTQPRGSKQQAVWSLPVKSFPGGDYMVTLKATDDAGSGVEIDRYAFRIVKK